MPTINIDINPNENNVFLSGDTDKVLENRRVRYYFIDLNSIINGGIIKIPYEEDTLEKIIDRIRNILSEFDINEILSKRIQEHLVDFFREEMKFKEFSSAAYSIREGNFSEKNKEDFVSFTQYLKKAFPSRILYNLQLLSAYHLAFSQNACNFSVPGSGKTSIVYAAYAYLKSLPKENFKHIEKLIIIGPLSSFGPWEMEYEACFGLLPNSKRLSGGLSIQDRINHFYSSSPAEISLISYQGLSGTIRHLEKFLKKYPCMVVLDEAHKIKNIEGGVIANSALSIAKYCQARVILTGTPAPNGYEDLYNLFKFIWPTKNVISFFEYQLKDMSKNNRDTRVPKLIEDIKPYFIRIKKSHLNLPTPINHEPIMVNMSHLQSDIYSYIENNYMAYFQSQGNQTNFQNILARARLIRLMQASTNPALLKRPLDEYYEEQGIVSNIFIDDNEIINKILDYSNTEIPPKFIKAAELIKQILDAGEKVIVWMIFVQNIKDFSKYLAKIGILSKSIWGETPVEQDDLSEEIETRESIISEFHTPNCEYKVLIANSFAISESISLHKACHNAIYIERSFNAGNFIQSKDRIHRYGLNPNDKINYYFLLSKNNIDITIHQRLNFKEARMLEIIEKEEIPLFHIFDEDGNNDDLRTLLDNYVTKSF